MSEDERHDRYKEAQDMSWAYVQEAEDALAMATGLPVHVQTYGVKADKLFARAQVWATIALALRRDGTPS